MGMRIQGGGGGYSVGAQDTQWQQRRQNFDALAQAISGGNLSGANDAFAKIQAQLPSGDAAKSNSFLDQIGAALKSGDIASAQQILAARFNNRNGDQASSVDPTQQAGAVTAANATTAAGATSSVGASSGSHGHHHHHHGGGGGASPAIDLSQAIQSGDAAKAQSAMQTILIDLQQVADMGSLATTGATGASGNPVTASAVSAASSLLQNPDFQALEAAVANGDASGMKSAWAKLVGAPDTASAATTDATAVTPAIA